MDKQNALAWSPKNRAHALIRRKSTLSRQCFRKAPFSPVHTTTWKRRFQKDPLWRAFSKNFVFDDWKRRFRVDGKMRFQKDPDTCGRGLILTYVISWNRSSYILDTILITNVWTYFTGVKGTGCTSNNIHEVERTIGIEAARFVLDLIWFINGRC